MYELIFKTHTVKCNSIQEWHKKVIKLEQKGLIYKNFNKIGNKYRFYYV